MQAHPDEQDDDENYNSASDDDFDPQAAANEADDAASSDDEAEDSTAAAKKKRKVAGEAEDLGFDNSGDEATVRKGQRNSKKKKKKRKDGDEQDELGGDGGLIKTRSQRLQETKEKKPPVQVGKATVDIDDLWAKMSAPPPQASSHHLPPTTIKEPAQEAEDNKTQGKQTYISVKPTSEPLPTADSGMVKIKRTYEFAGKTEEEERLVPVNSAEAKLYFAEQKKKEEPASNGAAKPGLRKVMKRKSMFTGTGAPQGAGYGAAAVAQAAKLNTLQKSRLDWAQQVDKDGTAEELDEHSRAKDSYSSRMDFLGRMDAKREQDSRRSH